MGSGGGLIFQRRMLGLKTHFATFFLTLSLDLASRTLVKVASSPHSQELFRPERLFPATTWIRTATTRSMRTPSCNILLQTCLPRMQAAGRPG
jgi:hypothetical protein